MKEVKVRVTLIVDGITVNYYEDIGKSMTYEEAMSEIKGERREWQR